MTICFSRWRKVFLLAALLALAGTSVARADCYSDAVAKSGVSAETFAAIQNTESSTNSSTCTAAVNAATVNTASHDYGCMQINSSNFAGYAKALGYPSADAYKSALMSDPCVGYQSAAMNLSGWLAYCKSKTGSAPSEYSAVCGYNQGGLDEHGTSICSTSDCAYANKVFTKSGLPNNVTTSAGATQVVKCEPLFKSSTKTLAELFSSGMTDGGNSAWVVSHRIFGNATPHNIGLQYCLSSNFKVFRLIYMATSLASFYAAVVTAVIQQLVDYACNYVMTLVDNALSRLCLPMPSLGGVDLGLTLPPSESCDGMPLLKANRLPNYQVDTGLTEYFKNIQRETGGSSPYYNYDIAQ